MHIQIDLPYPNSANPLRLIIEKSYAGRGPKDISRKPQVSSDHVQFKSGDRRL